MKIERHLWSGGAYFDANPEKIAGTVKATTNQFGQAVNVVKGGMADFLRIIPKGADQIENWLISNDNIQPVEKKVNKARQALAATKAITLSGGAPKITGDMLTFDEIRTRFASNISDDQYRIWTNYQLGRTFNAATILDPTNGWNKFAEVITDNEYLTFAKQGLVAYSGDYWVPDSVYFAGHVYDKINSLEHNKERVVRKIGDGLYQAQLKRLRATIPAAIRLSAPVSERLYIKPTDKFLDNFQIDQLTDGTMFDGYGVVHAFSIWLRSLPRKYFTNGSTAHNVIEYAMMGKAVRGDMSKAKAAEIKRKADQDLNNLFSTFLAEQLTEEDQQKIELLWNREYNGWVEFDYKNIPIGFEISRWFKSGLIAPRKALWEGVAFQTINGNSVIAFDVGVGKTMTAILAVAQAMYTGQCKRPLIVVPNPTYKKWIIETIGEYNEDGTVAVHGILPQYKDRVNDYYNLGVGYLDKAKNNPPQDYSITFMTFQGLLQMGLSASLQQEIGEEMLSIFSQGIDGREREKLREDVDKLMGNATAGTAVNFDDLGFDYLVFDEAHAAKKIFTKVRGDVDKDDKKEKRGRSGYAITSGEPTQIGLKTFMLSQYIQKRNNMRNICLLTATPFTNSPLEIYSMLSLVAYKSLKDRGISNIKAFFDKFVLEETETVVTQKGFAEKQIIKGFNNRLVLQNIMFSAMLHKTGEEANVKRPIKIVYPMTKDKNGITLPLDQQVETALTPTAEQAHWIDEIAKFANATTPNDIESALGARYYDEDDKITARDLLAVALGRQVALCPLLLRIGNDDMKTYHYFMGNSAPTAEQILEQSPKLQYTLGCLKTIKRYHDDHNEDMSCSVIYMNMGIEYLPALSSYFASELGLSPKEIEIISGGMDVDKKEAIKERFLAGKVKVLFGSSTIKEGIDLQNKTATLFNLTLDWNPTDIQQLEGRIYRQGNQFSHVRIVTPLLENSVDVFMFQKLEEKTARINSIWYRAGKGNVLDVDTFSPAELKLGLMTDPVERAKVDIKQEVNKIELKISVLSETIQELSEARSVIDEAKEVEHQITEWFDKDKSAFDIKVINLKTALEKDWYETKKDREQDEKDLLRIQSIFEKVEQGSELAKLALIKYAAVQYKRRYGYKNYTMDMRIDSCDRQAKRYKQLERLKKNVLNQNGLTLDSDLKPLITQYENDRRELNNDLAVVQSDDYFVESKRKLKQARIDADKSSKPVSERIKDFTKQNHLLSCMQGVHDCSIEKNNGLLAPVIAPITNIGADKSKRIRLAKARAQALLLLFEFQKLAA